MTSGKGVGEMTDPLARARAKIAKFREAGRSAYHAEQRLLDNPYARTEVEMIWQVGFMEAAKEDAGKKLTDFERTVLFRACVPK